MILFRIIVVFAIKQVEAENKNNTKKATKSVDFIALVPLTELFSNNFMEDLEKIWELRAIIPDPTTPPVLYRKSDVGDID